MTAAALPLRRSWLIEQIRPSAASKFFKILQALAPEKAPALRGQPGMHIYQALLEHLKPLLPVYEAVFGGWHDNRDVTEEAFDHGVPVCFYGLDEQAISYERSYDPAVALIWWLLPEDFEGWNEPEIDETEQTPRHSDLPAALTRHAGALNGLTNRFTSKKWTLPPRGRQWKGVWAFLPDTYAWVTHSTGYQLLDYSENNVLECDDMPPWDVDEVRNLIDGWRHAAPVWEGIKTLVTYIDDHREHLLALGLLLTGDETTRHLLSEPKRGRGGKTLAQVFMQDERHG